MSQTKQIQTQASTSQMMETAVKPFVNLSYSIAFVFLAMIIAALFVSAKVKKENKKKAIALIELGGMIAICFIAFGFFKSFK